MQAKLDNLLNMPRTFICCEQKTINPIKSSRTRGKKRKLILMMMLKRQKEVPGWEEQYCDSYKSWETFPFSARPCSSAANQSALKSVKISFNAWEANKNGRKLTRVLWGSFDVACCKCNLINIQMALSLLVKALWALALAALQARPASDQRKSIKSSETLCREPLDMLADFSFSSRSTRLSECSNVPLHDHN